MRSGVRGRPGLDSTALFGLGMAAGALLAWRLPGGKGERREEDSPSAELKARLSRLHAGRDVGWAAQEGEQVSDEVIVEHVRRQLDRPYLSHPGLVDVHVYDGRVLLTGVVLRAEVDDLVDRLSKVHGVQSYDSHLHVVESLESPDRQAPEQAPAPTRRRHPEVLRARGLRTRVFRA